MGGQASLHRVVWVPPRFLGSIESASEAAGWVAGRDEILSLPWQVLQPDPVTVLADAQLAVAVDLLSQRLELRFRALSNVQEMYFVPLQSGRGAQSALQARTQS